MTMDASRLMHRACLTVPGAPLLTGFVPARWKEHPVGTTG